MCADKKNQDVRQTKIDNSETFRRIAHNPKVGGSSPSPATKELEAFARF